MIISKDEMITSKDNQFLREVRALATKKERQQTGFFLIEGVRNAREAVASDLQVFHALYSDELQDEALLDELTQAGVPTFAVERGLLERAADARSCQGVVLVAKIAEQSLLPALTAGKKIAALAGISDPGNLGTIIRTARAAGLGGLVLLPDCADIYSPKVVRAAMGSLYHLPCVYLTNAELLALAEQHEYSLVTLDMDGTPIQRAALPERSLYILGSEAHGVGDFWRQTAEMSVSVPMADGVESLNAAVAAAIIFFAELWQK